jgi:ABC-type glutathione transport system ATPase component
MTQLEGALATVPAAVPDRILQAEDVRVVFRAGRGRRSGEIVALNDVSLNVERGQIVGLVGESGSGKSTFARVVCGLQAKVSGRILFNGVALETKRDRRIARQVQMVFQDPYSSLDPRMTVKQTLAELLNYHRVVPRSQVAKRCAELLDLVQLPQRSLEFFPASMSGGQRQRVAIARALALGPDLLVADEAVSALDVSVQAGIINLLSDLRDELGLSILFIAHDLAVVRTLCDRVAVINRGDIVEERPCLELFDSPQHEYTKQLLNSIPRLDGPRTVKLGAERYR